MSKDKQVDKILLVSLTLLVIFGLVIFFSASLGLLARDGARFGSVVSNQILLGLFLGSIGCYLASKINYKTWGRYSFWVFLFSVVVTLSVFIPGVGFEHGGARRWISIGSLTFQPAELLKFTYILYLSAWIATVKSNVSTFKGGFAPFVIITGIVASTLLLQPDTDTTFIIILSGLVIYFVSGANIKHILAFVIVFAVVSLGLIMSRPYLMQRVTTFINPNQDVQTSGYQIRQSLIAIGSGGFTGRGFGQSVQKFNYLPEPIGDSILAVASEEFGFIGTSILVLLFLIFAFRSIFISFKVKDTFGGLLMLGVAIMIVAQSLLNMSSMLGIFPLSGLPLTFVSHGGTSLFFSLCAGGVMLNISRHKNI